MKHIRHLCQAGDCAQKVAAAVKGEIVPVVDDCSIGTLQDIDTPSPVARAAFWNTIFQRWPIPEIDFHHALCLTHDRLAGLASGTDEVVIWAGTSSTEQLLRRRVHWWLREATLEVSEVLVSPKDTGMNRIPEAGHLAVALISPEKLRSLFTLRTRVKPELRRKLAAEWEKLRENGEGIRVQEEGNLQERPVDYYDGLILSFITNQPQLFAHIQGQAMAATYQTDNFCRWRIIKLIEDGKVILHGTLSDGYAAKLSRNP